MSRRYFKYQCSKQPGETYNVKYEQHNFTSILTKHLFSILEYPTWQISTISGSKFAVMKLSISKAWKQLGGKSLPSQETAHEMLVSLFNQGTSDDLKTYLPIAQYDFEEPPHQK